MLNEKKKPFSQFSKTYFSKSFTLLMANIPIYTMDSSLRFLNHFNILEMNKIIKLKSLNYNEENYVLSAVMHKKLYNYLSSFFLDI